MRNKYIKLAIVIGSFFLASHSFSATFCYALHTDLGHVFEIKAYDTKGYNFFWPPVGWLFLKSSKRVSCFDYSNSTDQVKLYDSKGRAITLANNPNTNQMPSGFYRIDPFKYTATYVSDTASAFLFAFHPKYSFHCTMANDMSFYNADDTTITFPYKQWAFLKESHFSFSYDGGVYSTGYVRPRLFSGYRLLNAHFSLDGKSLPNNSLPPGAYSTVITHCDQGETPDVSFYTDTPTSSKSQHVGGTQTPPNLTGIKDIFSKPK